MCYVLYSTHLEEQEARLATARVFHAIHVQVHVELMRKRAGRTQRRNNSVSLTFEPAK